MGRIRYNLEQAQHKAVLRASEFVSGLPGYAGFQVRRTYPDTTVPRSRASKHPLAWIVVFAFDPLDGSSMDGGELIVAVNLDSGMIAIRE